MNPLFKALGGGAMPSLPGPLGNFQQMVRKFHEFKANFQGDPEQEVKRLPNVAGSAQPASAGGADVPIAALRLLSWPRLSIYFFIFCPKGEFYVHEFRL